MYRYLFGPVPSRRLGRSLGVDLVSLKTCSFDCIFCQAGRTTNGTLDRREYVSTDAVMEELRCWLNSGGVADYITFSGSGEPTLHNRIGDIIRGIRSMTNTKIAVLTNSTLLHFPEVRSDIRGADLVKASLSACDSDSLQKLCRPIGNTGIVQLIEGLKTFRHEFEGVLWLEVFLVAGVNDDSDSVKKIAGIAESIGPDRVHLNTVVRKPSEERARAVAPERMVELAKIFDPPAEIIPQVNIKPSKDVIRTRPVIEE